MQLISPKQAAQAIGVSESSLKRWCDRGLLKSVRTAGGHRRLEMDTIVRFLRDSGRGIVRPELLGLPSSVGRGDTVVDVAREQLRDALLDGDEERARRIVFDLYLAGQSASDICDRVVAIAFHEIGHGWERGTVVVYRERRACEIALKVLHELRRSMPVPPADAPNAIGGTIEGDPYCLPTAMVELALHETGWRATSLGTMLPAATLIEALHENQPQLMWISVSTIRSIPEFLEEYRRLQGIATGQGTAIAVGGRALTAEIRQQMNYSAYCDTLRHLVTFAHSIQRPSRSRRATTPNR
jgi:excisionase family DNA binding protein